MEERSLTIKIRYYPISKRTLASSVLILLFYCLGILAEPAIGNLFPQQNEWIAFDTFASPRQSLWRSGDTFDTLDTFHIKAALAQEKPQVEEVIQQQPSIKNDHVISNGPREKKQVALTFDADMTPQMKKDLDTGETKNSYNQKIVEILNQTQTKATVFASGMWIEYYPEVTKELAANPLFEFGNHSYSHPSFDGFCWGLHLITDAEEQPEIQKTQDLLKQYTGKENKLFRFPGGCYSQKDIELTQKNGLYVVHWDSVGNDGFNDDAQNIEKNVLSSAQNGSVIVLHFNGYPNSPKTAEALPKIISTLKEKGYEFVKVTELLGLDEKPREVVSLPSF